MGRRSKVEEQPGYRGVDSPEIIQQCLACPKADCSNCIDWQKKKSKAAQKREEDMEG